MTTIKIGSKVRGGPACFWGRTGIALGFADRMGKEMVDVAWDARAGIGGEPAMRCWVQRDSIVADEE